MHPLATKDVESLQEVSLGWGEVSLAFHVQLMKAWEDLMGVSELRQVLVVLGHSLGDRTGESAGNGTDYLENMVPDQSIGLEVDHGKAMITRASVESHPGSSLSWEVRGDEAAVDRMSTYPVAALESCCETTTNNGQLN